MVVGVVAASTPEADFSGLPCWSTISREIGCFRPDRVLPVFVVVLDRSSMP
jgi:hypothetical protein